MSLIAFRRGRDQAGRWKDGRLQEEPPPPPPEPSPGAPDPGADARSFYESLIAEGGGAEPPQSPRKRPRDLSGEGKEPPSPSDPPHFCRSCGASFRDPPARHRRSTAHLLGLGGPPAPPAPLHIPPSNPGYRLLLRGGWAGGGLGRGGPRAAAAGAHRAQAGPGWAGLGAGVAAPRHPLRAGGRGGRGGAPPAGEGRGGQSGARGGVPVPLRGGGAGLGDPTEGVHGALGPSGAPAPSEPGPPLSPPTLPEPP
ncbi:G patch domain and ankyrin repeat-containing protein 1 [Corvus moneduloides]|uniref:G patch domain and ankyrin repeat-containing protein 1 n=1 Tax=Corvus moneduloides TaxID=1196302 RepID=UPI001362FE79|nr:G patch domain and ankyrin repeat-containing protein 1 [Corvus moneduloides]